MILDVLSPLLQTCIILLHVQSNYNLMKSHVLHVYVHMYVVMYDVNINLSGVVCCYFV